MQKICRGKLLELIGQGRGSLQTNSFLIAGNRVKSAHSVINSLKLKKGLQFSCWVF